MFLNALHINLLDFTFALVVPAPPTHQYDDTPDDGVSTILEEEEGVTRVSSPNSIMRMCVTVIK